MKLDIFRLDKLVIWYFRKGKHNEDYEKQRSKRQGPKYNERLIHGWCKLIVTLDR